MMRFVCIVMLTALPVWVGCGNKPVEVSDSTDSKSGKADSSTAQSNKVPPPSVVVGMFLDSLRKGDELTLASLFTQAARDEIKKNGIEVAPMGSAKATYTVGDWRYADQDKDVALVDSEWSEPKDASTEALNTQVVWAVKLEKDGWRVSGMFIDRGQTLDPVVVDFENWDEKLVADQHLTDDTGLPQNNGSLNSGIPSNTLTGNQLPNASTAFIPADGPIGSQPQGLNQGPQTQGTAGFQSPGVGQVPASTTQTVGSWMSQPPASSNQIGQQQSTLRSPQAVSGAGGQFQVPASPGQNQQVGGGQRPANSGSTAPQHIAMPPISSPPNNQMRR